LDICLGYFNCGDDFRSWQFNGLEMINKQLSMIMTQVRKISNVLALFWIAQIWAWNRLKLNMPDAEFIPTE